MFDYLKKTVGAVTNPIGTAFTAAKNLYTSATTKAPNSTPYQPAPNIQTTKGPAYVAPPKISQPVANKPVAPSTSLKTAPGQYPTPEVAQSMVDQKMTNDMNVAPKSTVKASATSPENTKSSLQQARKTLEDQFLSSLKPNKMTEQLADLRLEAANLTEKYDKEYKALKTNPEGKLSGNLDAQLRGTKEKQNEQLGYLALRETALTGALQLDKDQQKSIIDNIKTISGMTDADMIGSLDTDPVTGDVYAYFKDPTTGEIEQKTVGKTNIKPEYDIRTVGGRVVALDSEGNIVKDIGSSSDGSGLAGFQLTPTDKQSLFAAGMSAERIAQLQSDVNTFGFDAATSGLTQAQKNAVTNVVGGTNRFLSTDYLLSQYKSTPESKKKLEDKAIEAGYGSKGFLGIGRKVSDEDLNNYINTSIMSRVEQLRDQGVGDDEILKQFKKK